MPITEQEYRIVVREVRKYVPGVKIRRDEDGIIDMLERGTQACYCHQDDTIFTRGPKYYRSVRTFRHILFHELGHWATRAGRGGRVRPLTQDSVDAYAKAIVKKAKLNVKLNNKIIAEMTNGGIEEMIVDAVAHHFCIISGQAYSTKIHQQYIDNWAKRINLSIYWNARLQRYFHRKVKSLILFIKKQQKNR